MSIASSPSVGVWVRVGGWLGGGGEIGCALAIALLRNSTKVKLMRSLAFETGRN